MRFEREHLYAYDRAGTLLFEQAGTARTVNLTDAQEDALRASRGGAVVTHNHPDGGPLSKYDAASFAHIPLYELRAVGLQPDGRVSVYRLQRPGRWRANEYARIKELWPRDRKSVV